MEIKENGFEVIGLPVITKIHVQVDDDGPHVIYAGQGYTPDEWREFTEACIYVRDRLISGGGPREPWNRIEDVPSAVRQVIDCEGDQWTRKRDGSWPEARTYLNRYAPFRLP